jgi:penicillin-binding protein 1A
VRFRAWRARRKAKPRLKRLRFLAILIALLALGGISFAFGMFMAVASDLPALEDKQQYQHASNSILLDDHGHPYAVLSKQNQILVSPQQIPPIVKEAVISIEDKRFYTNAGIDPRSIARAFVHDIFGGGGTQGASTIEEQFVKNALQAQAHRTFFEKLKEAALAFHLDHRWSKEKIITEYLNAIYFGNGAYGIEAAAKTYFGQDVNHLGCGTPEHLCVSELKPWEAALLAGIIQSPTEYNPVTHPQEARERRDIVLKQMELQGYIDKRVYDEGLAAALPAPSDIRPPREQIAENVDAGYFTSWVSQQVISRYGPTAAFYGGLHVKTTLDLELQRAAEHSVSAFLSNPEGPTASVVAIENSTGDVRAMVGGRDYETSPFNLATEGERQPGSSFKAFDLAAALEDGISPYSVWPSRVKVFHVPHSSELFVVHNDEGSYTGTNTLIGATAVSDNSIYAEVGIKVGTKKIAHVAHEMGITTPISTNYAMTIGGLQVGVTPLDMAHAYETIAHGGQRVSGSLAGEKGAPVGIQEVVSPHHDLPNGHHHEINRPSYRRVLPSSIAQTETEMLETVITEGTGTSAAIGQFAAGKTGTTSNYVDAWFVGWDSKYTVAVWVGFPEGAKEMTTDFDGQPVYGGTYPALIWHDFMLSAIAIEQERANAKADHRNGLSEHGGAASTVQTPTIQTPTTGATTGTEGGQTERGTGAAGTGTGTTEEATAPTTKTPVESEATTPTEAPQEPTTPTEPVEQEATQEAPAAPSEPSGATGGATAPTGGASAGG